MRCPLPPAIAGSKHHRHSIHDWCNIPFYFSFFHKFIVMPVIEVTAYLQFCSLYIADILAIKIFIWHPKSKFCVFIFTKIFVCQNLWAVCLCLIIHQQSPPLSFWATFLNKYSEPQVCGSFHISLCCLENICMSGGNICAHKSSNVWQPGLGAWLKPWAPTYAQFKMSW